jgi:hypothetical protein
VLRELSPWLHCEPNDRRYTRDFLRRDPVPGFQTLNWS